MPYSDEYVHHLEQGPFPGRIDPWAEAPRYFQQIHAGLIGALLEALRLPLMHRGYMAGREASLLIAENHEPDLQIGFANKPQPSSQTTWDYAAAAEAVHLEPGLLADTFDADIHNVVIRDIETGDIVTVVEVVSPTNKVSPEAMLRYEGKRASLVHEQGVNLVELDLTRSVKRLVTGKIASAFAYHIAIHLPREITRIVGNDFIDKPKSFALPLRNEVMVVDTYASYELGYRQASIAAQIRKERRYQRDELPFPSLLTQVQRDEVVTLAAKWLKTLDEIQQHS